MKKTLTLFFLCAFIYACKEDKEQFGIEIGFEHVARHGPSHFVYVHEKYWGKRKEQKDVGRKICQQLFKEDQYCEVYYFASKRDIPQKFPITNRMNPIGIFEIKNGKQSFRALTIEENNLEEGNVVFYKNFRKWFFGGSRPAQKKEGN